MFRKAAAWAASRECEIYAVSFCLMEGKPKGVVLTYCEVSFSDYLVRAQAEGIKASQIGHWCELCAMNSACLLESTKHRLEVSAAPNGSAKPGHSPASHARAEMGFVTGSLQAVGYEK